MKQGWNIKYFAWSQTMINSFPDINKCLHYDSNRNNQKKPYLLMDYQDADGFMEL